MQGLPCQAEIDNYNHELAAAKDLRHLLVSFLDSWEWKDHDNHELDFLSTGLSKFCKSFRNTV